METTAKRKLGPGKDPNKVDLRLDPGLREKIDQLAVERFEARIHHITGKPEITSTINRLIRYGIEYLDKGYLDNYQNHKGRYPDNLVTRDEFEAIAAKVKKLTDAEIDWQARTAMMRENTKLENQVTALQESLESLKSEVLTLEQRQATLAETTIPGDSVQEAIAELKAEFQNQVNAVQQILENLTRAIEPDDDELEAESSQPINYFPEPESETAIAVEATDVPIRQLDLIEADNSNRSSHTVTQNFNQGLTGAALARRLGVDQSVISRNAKKGPEHFKEWSRNPKNGGQGGKIADPDGYAWERREDRLFYPI
jgi:hypothetical protein